MSHQCKGWCRDFRISVGGRNKRYRDGAKFCKTCNDFLKCNSFVCLCCGTKLRGRPKNKQDFESYRMEVLAN